MTPNRDETAAPPTAVVRAIVDAPQPVVNTRYLAGEFDVEPAELREELYELVDDGVLEHLEIRGRTHLWWLSLEAEADLDDWLE
ncbi:hypothetical protein [Natrononativus amylolyticus]|uniref:hypothetical protein n=1 Tax=Natrononativus amylolyticus TaxID=2963434 RepID=UPI0020CD0964|nr:hypothetical protein [Natrononativus amylolyticus]